MNEASKNPLSGFPHGTQSGETANYCLPPNTTAPVSGFQDVRVNGKLLFRYDAARDLVEIKRDGMKAIVDLTQYR